MWRPVRIHDYAPNLEFSLGGCRQTAGFGGVRRDYQRVMIIITAGRVRGVVATGRAVAGPAGCPGARRAFVPPAFAPRGGRGPALAGRLDSVESYNPASYRGVILRLHYARASELGPWLDLVAVRGEVVVQFWLKPGEVAVTLGPGEEREVQRIPEQLRRFFGSRRMMIFAIS